MCELVHTCRSLEVVIFTVGFADSRELHHESVDRGRATGSKEEKMDFAGPGKPLTQKALEEAGGIVGIPAAAMWAVIHVESSGAGYLGDRCPKILFERHLFHRSTGGRFDATH